ncbi:hypothetical protein AGABI1DRAFT_113763 [Agaricus bisporus var. burnettii JB137-S8]|uniref:Uncharacterized protein n=2 Tax=Agaricus bisporus var. burnettii TaxID=192524 RepID=K5XVH5_AGABU|nr:uncharacterized protein AGABI1DRAFT_113763 [Agaricus bisporus var. burnettii JB137-S8]EKM79155.1 hypothetical protein AGABI1DRAFT_113763 [Agaricus bisporus var. burnettii JB137-S8]KAF7768527.1 hypothetical protein Agabi119p4_7770 [Agaricus bisporus var. burnettii]
MSTEQFPITAAQLAGNFCETLFYGMYLVTSGFCARSLLFTGCGHEERWLRPDEIRWMMVVIASLLFVICTFDVAIGLLHNFHAFVQSDNPEKELLNLGDWINITRSCTQVGSMFIGDFVLIYRCWVVYGRRWLVVLPSIILYLAGIAMGVMFIEVEANPTTDKASALSASAALRWGMAVFAITAFQNTLTSGILIWRIWRVDRESERHFSLRNGFTARPPSHLRKVIRVIAESGAAYTTMVLITFFVAVSRSNALYPTSNMTLISTGIAFNVIIVRSSAKRDRQFTQFDLGTAVSESNPTARSTTFGSINFIPNRRKVERDVELATVKTDHSVKRYSPEPDIYLGASPFPQ